MEPIAIGLNWEEHEYKAKPSVRNSHSSCADDTGTRCFMFGGRAKGGIVSEVWVIDFDRLVDGWRRLKCVNAGPSPRKSSGICFWRPDGIGAGRLYVYGGLPKNSKDPVGDLWFLDLKTLRWELTNNATGKLPKPRDRHAIITLNGVLYLFGGHNIEFEFLNDLHTYDPIKNHWTEILPEGPKPQGRYEHAFVKMESKLLITGGKGKRGGISDWWLYDPDTGWTQYKVHQKNKIVPRWGGGVCYHSGILMHFGGWDGRTCFGEIDAIDTTSSAKSGERKSRARKWVHHRLKILAPKRPVARTFHSFVSSNKHILLFGGRNVKRRLNDTWTVSFESIKRQMEYDSRMLQRSKLYYLAQERPITPKDFLFKATLGKGSFGRVRLTQCTTKEFFALKILKKSKVIQTKQVKHVLWEKKILSTIVHPFIVNLEACFKDQTRLYFALEFVQGGEFFSLLRKTGVLEMPHCAFYTSQIVLVFLFLHRNRIVYRDLKPENLLIGLDGYLKLTDFGFAKCLINRKKTQTLCGTPEYIAPEILRNQGHGFPVDWWALGILLFEMFCGSPPFEDDDAMKIYKKILVGAFIYPSGVKVPSRATSFISALLKQNPRQRLGSKEYGAMDVMGHEFFRGVSWNMILRRKVRAPYIPVVDGPDDPQHFEKYDEDTDSEEELSQSYLGDNIFEEF